LNRKMVQYIGEGVLRALIVTIIAVLIFSLISNQIAISQSVTSVLFIVFTMLSIIYGAVIATRKINKNGWVNGLLVSAIYLACIITISKLAGNDNTAGISLILRIAIGLVVGMLAGMLGINI